MKNNPPISQKNQREEWQRNKESFQHHFLERILKEDDLLQPILPKTQSPQSPTFYAAQDPSKLIMLS